MKTFLWVVFNLFIMFLLWLDLAVFHKKDEEVKVKEALWWSLIWTILALLFNLGVYWVGGHDRGLQFLTGYVLERSLSIDNLFVFLLIFNYFQVPARYQRKILFWGILGAVLTRAGFIVGGIALIERFHFIIYVLGAILVFSGFKLFSEKDKEMDPGKNPILSLFKKVMPVTTEYQGGNFFVKLHEKWHATPLFIVLLAIETTDVVFAVDSIPAILSITIDPFIVYSSNIFAILGLRALYFALAGLMQVFRFLHYGLGVILIFVGAKMLMSHFYEIPVLMALGVIGLVLLLSTVASLIFPEKKQP